MVSRENKKVGRQSWKNWAQKLTREKSLKLGTGLLKILKGTILLGGYGNSMATLT